jgi:hypothetical protein
MLSRTHIVSNLTLSTAMLLSAAAVSGDLPKEGSDAGTYSGYGTYKVVPIGKERLLIRWDENGLNISNGYSDHTTWHCWGTGDYIKGVGQDKGNCVGTAPDGDQIVQSVECEKHPIDQKTFKCTSTYAGGTGKFTGITGVDTNLCHSGEFKSDDGSYLQYCTWSTAPYKLVAD